jgi:AraC-like DNA-binding protein
MPAAYFLLILREHGTTARLRAALLEGTGVREGSLGEAGAEVTLGQVLRLLRNAAAVLEPGWALEMGSQLHASTHGPVGFATVSAPTLAKGLEVLARFGHVRAPFFRIRASSRGREHRLVFVERVELGDEERAPLLEMVQLSGQALVESVLGRPVKEALFEFPYPAPSYASLYGRHYHGSVRFDAGEAAVVIPAEWLKLECPMADPVMFEAALRSLDTGDRRLESTTFTVARVEQLIASRGDAFGLEEAARMLHLSRRTLLRRLRAAGTSYGRLVEAHQKSRAEQLLRDRQLNVSEVAYSLGYEDAANFGRACRRWFGMSPGRYRERLTQQR